MFNSLAAFAIADATLSPIVWFALDADLHLEAADLTTSTAAPSKIAAPERFKLAHVADHTTIRTPGQNEAERLAF